jgi:hypothetical protein
LRGSAGIRAGDVPSSRLGAAESLGDEGIAEERGELGDDGRLEIGEGRGEEATAIAPPPAEMGALGWSRLAI